MPATGLGRLIGCWLAGQPRDTGWPRLCRSGGLIKNGAAGLFFSRGIHQSCRFQPPSSIRKTRTRCSSATSLWIFGFTGSHRFYYGKPITGTIWFFTLGLLGIGWLIDLFLIPGMDRRADMRYQAGPYDYNVAWILLTFFGLFGLHRFYLGKILTGILYIFTGGLFLLGVLYDFWTLNGQVSGRNSTAVSGYTVPIV